MKPLPFRPVYTKQLEGPEYSWPASSRTPEELKKEQQEIANCVLSAAFSVMSATIWQSALFVFHVLAQDSDTTG